MDQKIMISYDKEADVMYMSFGEPSKAVGDEVDEGVFARYDPTSHALMGFTIINFSRKFDKQPKAIGISVKA